MRSRYRINDPEAPHFITSTIVEWLPIFTTSACCDIVVRSLVYCRERKSLRIYGWVILDNHFHAIVAGPELARTIADLKKFTAREILVQLKRERRDWLLNQLRYFCATYKPPTREPARREPASIRFGRRVCIRSRSSGTR
jgi:REP element-mobilizing transposase RayT